MKGTRHSEEQIIAILKQGEAGLATADLCRQHGISEQTYYRLVSISISGRANFASPKSSTFTCPRCVINMFAGLISR